jgi:ABC-type multidrug transport system fused ATPase/permease subunit
LLLIIDYYIFTLTWISFPLSHYSLVLFLSSQLIFMVSHKRRHSKKKQKYKTQLRLHFILTLLNKFRGHFAAFAHTQKHERFHFRLQTSHPNTKTIDWIRLIEMRYFCICYYCLTIIFVYSLIALGIITTWYFGHEKKLLEKFLWLFHVHKNKASSLISFIHARLSNIDEMYDD